MSTQLSCGENNSRSDSAVAFIERRDTAWMKVADMDDRAKDLEQVGAQEEVKAVVEKWERAPAGHVFVQNAARRWPISKECLASSKVARSAGQP
jgi:hypothetical protein